MAVCTFCGETIELGTGILHVQNDGKIFRFCSSKCKKHQLKFDHKPIHVRWTKKYKSETAP